MKKKASSFCCASWKDRLKELLPFGIGILLMAFAIHAAMKRVTAVETDIRKRTKTVTIVVASVSIPAGVNFHTENLAGKTVPVSGTGRRNVFAPDFDLLLGAKSKNAIDPGEPILWTDVEEPFDTDIFSKTVPEGRRALTLTVDTTSSFSGLLRPGDRVDLLAKDENNRSKWIQNISVIAIDRNINRSARPEDVGETSAVTLMVTTEEGSAIAEASTENRLFWFLKNPNDNTIVPLHKNNTAHPAVELWHAGARVMPPTINTNGGESKL